MLDEPSASSPLAVPFDEAIDADEIWPEIRRAESLYMAERIKAALEAAVERKEAPWGAVRVTPRASHAFDVIVSGAILRSDGDGIAFRAQVHDASGRTWIAGVYESPAVQPRADGSVAAANGTVADAFARPAGELARDMADWVRANLPLKDRHRLRALAEVRFVRDFAPESFAGHVSVDGAGVVELKRLPARDDPMLVHGRRIRSLEQRFVDALDDHYGSFSQRMATPYRNWRQAVQGGVITRRNIIARARARRAFGAVALIGGLSGQSGGDDEAPSEGLPRHDFATVVSAVANLYSASRESDAAVAWTQLLEELGQSTSAAIAPHLLETENRTVRLTGAVDEQYDELRRIMAVIYREETTGEPPLPGEEDFERHVATAEEIVTRPTRPSHRPMALTAPRVAPSGSGTAGRSNDEDDPLFALRPGDFVPNPPPAKAAPTVLPDNMPMGMPGLAPVLMERIFRDMESDISRPMGAPRMPKLGSRASAFPESAFRTETPFPMGANSRPDAAPSTGDTLEELALLAREHRERGDDAGALRLLEEGLGRIGILDEACPLVCALVPLKPLPEHWPKSARRGPVGPASAYKRMATAQQHILDDRIEEGLDVLAPELRRSKRLPLRTLADVVQLHMHAASIEGSRGNHAAATRIYERLLDVAKKVYPPSMESSIFWRAAQSTFLAGDYPASLNYLERWLSRSPIMARACPTVCAPQQG
ncbi:MAG: hypothetical protein F4Y86_06895 [Gammaproteobacteria bacterium]|nr:hypothetical protein [Gammaproteobacteria bacterium]MYB37887.1 hypothetical protein [Gammaproteobacteria bacterium]